MQKTYPNRNLLQGMALLAILGGVGSLTLQHSKERGQAPAPVPAPAGATILFSGKEDEVHSNFVKQGTDQPAQWKIEGDGMVVGGGGITTKEKFADYQLHVEFKTPFLPNARGQARGNSGIGLQAKYEVQVLDSFGLKTPGTGDCGSIYNQSAPLLVASRPPKEWQTYDIVFRRPHKDADGKFSKARVTVLHNGLVVQNNYEMKGATGIGQGADTDQPDVIIFQDHGNKVEYRNIWVVPLPDKGSDKYDGV